MKKRRAARVLRLDQDALERRLVEILSGEVLHLLLKGGPLLKLRSTGTIDVKNL
jgi:hypothetical protein